MIRIQNIARENRLIRKPVCWLRFPDGQSIRVLRKRVVSIDYETFLLNRDAIILPGEDILPTTCFRVVRGAEYILELISDGKRDQVIEEQASPDVPESSIEGEDGLVDEVADDVTSTDPEQEPEVEIEAIEDDEVEVEPEEDDEEVEIEEPAEVEDEEEKDTQEDSKAILDELMELTHKELDVMLDEYGITVPPRSNKTVKAKAIISHHLTG